MTTYFYKLSLKQKIDKKMIFPEIEKMKQYFSRGGTRNDFQ